MIVKAVLKLLYDEICFMYNQWFNIVEIVFICQFLRLFYLIPRKYTNNQLHFSDNFIVSKVCFYKKMPYMHCIVA